MNVRLSGRVRILAALAVLISGSVGFAADLIIAENGQCDYQIVLPDKTLHPKIDRILAETAGVMQEMLKANGTSAPVVKEAEAEAGKPCIYVGDTAAARAAGVEASALPVWSYVMKVSGKDVIIAGRDWPAGGDQTSEDPPSSLGSANGMTDFMREYCGTRFLAPAGPPGIEFLPTDPIVVPDDLDVRREPMLSFNEGGDYKDDVASIGLNFFTNVTSELSGHTHEHAVPPEVYGETHPEYFALINGQRRNRGLQLCYSNKDVQELIYKDMLRSFDAGYPWCLSLQADGFQGCQCDECKKLYNTDSWTEKLWLLNKMWAERLQEDRPGKIIVVSAYTVTEHPPESFDKFPPNLWVSCRSTEEALKEWSAKMSGAMSTYLHAWGGYHLCAYMPVRTPLYAQDLVKLFVRYNVKGTRLDSPPALMWGMEGPTVYTYARMLDDPENNSAQELVKEYIEAAYGPAAPPMTRFFDELHHTLEIYARVFGVDDGSFQHYRRADGRSVRYLTRDDKLRLIGFLYPPELLERLESQLAQAERTPNLSDKRRLRLKLIRREFDYLKSTVRVVHMYNAFLTQKCPDTLDQLLTEMEQRRDMIMQWFAPAEEVHPEYRGRSAYLQVPISPDWELYIGAWRYYPDHLLANGGGYLASPVPPFTWDIDAVRHSAVFEPKEIVAKRTDALLFLGSRQWNDVPASRFGALSVGGRAPARPGEVKVAYDEDVLYVRFEGELRDDWAAPPVLKRDDEDIVKGESFTFLAAPDNNPARYYRFSAGVNPTAQYDARQGFIEDSINPLVNRDDLAWNPDWSLECAVAPDGKSWRALMVIPVGSMGAAAPAAGTEWKVNFSRMQPGRRGRGEISIWSAGLSTNAINDRQAFGTLLFE